MADRPSPTRGGTPRRKPPSGDDGRSTLRTRSSRTAAGRTGCGRTPRTAAERDLSEADAELVETSAHRLGRGLEQAGDGSQVLRPDGEHTAVEVLPLHLDHPEVAAEQIALGGGQLL